MLINELNKYGENNNIEVKKEVPAEHKKYLKSVVAFANSSDESIAVETLRTVGIVIIERSIDGRSSSGDFVDDKSELAGFGIIVVHVGSAGILAEIEIGRASCRERV